MLGAKVDSVASVEDAAQMIGALRHCIRRAADEAKGRGSALARLENELKRAKMKEPNNDEMEHDSTEREETCDRSAIRTIERIVKELFGKVEAVGLNCEAGNAAEEASSELQSKVTSLKRYAMECKIKYEEERSRSRENERGMKALQELVKQMSHKAQQCEQDVSSLASKLNSTTLEFERIQSGSAKCKGLNTRLMELNVQLTDILAARTRQVTALQTEIATLRKQHLETLQGATEERFKVSVLESSVEACRLADQQAQERVDSFVMQRQDLKALLLDLRGLTNSARAEESQRKNLKAPDASLESSSKPEATRPHGTILLDSAADQDKSDLITVPGANLSEQPGPTTEAQPDALPRNPNDAGGADLNAGPTLDSPRPNIEPDESAEPQAAFGPQSGYQQTDHPVDDVGEIKMTDEEGVEYVWQDDPIDDAPGPQIELDTDGANVTNTPSSDLCPQLSEEKTARNKPEDGMRSGLDERQSSLSQEPENLKDRNEVQLLQPAQQAKGVDEEMKTAEPSESTAAAASVSATNPTSTTTTEEAPAAGFTPAHNADPAPGPCGEGTPAEALQVHVDPEMDQSSVMATDELCGTDSERQITAGDRVAAEDETSRSDPTSEDTAAAGHREPQDGMEYTQEAEAMLLDLSHQVIDAARDAGPGPV